MIALLLTILTLLADPPSCWVDSPVPDPNIYHCASVECTIVGAHPNPPAAPASPRWQLSFVWPAGQLGNPVNAVATADPNDPNTAPVVTAAWDVEPVAIHAWLQHPYDLDYDGDCDRDDCLTVVRAARLSRADMVWLIEQMGYSPYDVDNSGRITPADYSPIKAHIGERWPTTQEDAGAPSLPRVGDGGDR